MKSVLITGVCGGIGQALARALIEEDWVVYGTDIVDGAIADSLAVFWKGDVAELEFWSKVIVPELKEKGSLDAFVHNAAIQPCSKIVETSLDEWNSTLAVNLTAAYLGTRFLVPLMKSGQGSIVNVTSVHSLASSAGMAAYVASKGGLLAFTRAAALELAPQNIKVNAIAPGAIETLMLKQGLERHMDGPEQARENLVSRTPMKRLGSPAEIAKSIIFLLDPDRSPFLTGQTLVVDGGALAQLSTE